MRCRWRGCDYDCVVGGLVAQNRIEATWLASFALVAFPLLDAFVRAGEAVVHAPEYQDSLRRLKDSEKDTPTPVSSSLPVTVDAGHPAAGGTADTIDEQAAALGLPRRRPAAEQRKLPLCGNAGMERA